MINNLNLREQDMINEFNTRALPIFKGNGFFSAYYPAKAFMCHNCKKIIIDFSEINSNNSK